MQHRRAITRYRKRVSVSLAGRQTGMNSPLRGMTQNKGMLVARMPQDAKTDWYTNTDAWRMITVREVSLMQWMLQMQLQMSLTPCRH